MEQKWKIKTSDNACIYGVMNSTKATNSAVFMVHGLTGHMNEYAFKRAAGYFEKQYDVYRFNLYDGEDGGRSLVDCTIQQHAKDLNRVLDEFGSKYDNIFLIGHSYGGPTVMIANPNNITAVSLWDPSYDLSRIQKDFSKNYVEKEDYYIVHWGTSFLIGKDMYNEAGKLNALECVRLSKKFKSPVQVIHAEDGYYIKDKESYHSYGDKRNIQDIISGTVHCFYEGNSCDDLLRKTDDWFKRFI